MPNRIIRDKLWSSNKLAECSIQAQLHYPRIYLLVDDWSCFEIDIAVIRGKVYPKMPKISPAMIEEYLDEYHKNGLLFRWKVGRTECGYFTGSEEGRLPAPTRRHKRTTFEPPEDDITSYLQDYNCLQSAYNELQDDYLSPSPSPNPKPSLILFNKFWNCYPRKQAKKKALEKWQTLNPDEQLTDKIIKAVEKAKKSEQWEKPSMIPMPTTYLNGERWEDELMPKNNKSVYKPKVQI